MLFLTLTTICTGGEYTHFQIKLRRINPGMQVLPPARHRGLKIRHCRRGGIDGNCGSGSDPWPGNSICHRVAKKKKPGIIVRTDAQKYSPNIQIGSVHEKDPSGPTIIEFQNYTKKEKSLTASRIEKQATWNLGHGSEYSQQQLQKS